MTTKNERRINNDHEKNNKKVTFLCKKKNEIESLRAWAMHQRNLRQEEDDPSLPQ